MEVTWSDVWNEYQSVKDDPDFTIGCTSGVPQGSILGPNNSRQLLTLYHKVNSLSLCIRPCMEVTRVDIRYQSQSVEHGPDFTIVALTIGDAAMTEATHTFEFIYGEKQHNNW